MTTFPERENAPLRGRPVGTRKQYKAERRLARELADKQLRNDLVTGGLGLLAELARTAKSNPVTGLALGIIIVDVLHRSSIVSLTAARAFYALFSVSAAADVVRAITAAFPFSSDAEQRNAAQPTGQAITEATGVAIPPATFPKGTVSKEFL